MNGLRQLFVLQWLRDSAVQAAIYFSRVEQHPSLRILLEGVIRTHAYFVLQVLQMLPTMRLTLRRCAVQ